MKTLKKILAIAVLSLAFFSCKNEVQPEVKTVEVEQAKETVKSEVDPNATYAKAEFKIEGMTCAMGCAKTIEKKIAKMEGVKSAKVDFDRQLAMVEYNEDKVNPTSLENTVTSVADTYSVKDMKTVEAFSKKECTKKCSSDCTKKDCEKCAAKTAECKKKCDAKKAEGSKEGMACAEDCKKACCAKAEKV